MKQVIIVLLAIALIGGGGFWYIQNAKKDAVSMPKTSNTNSNTKNTGTPAANEKSGTTTKVGKITENAGKFYLQEAGQTPKEIESYVVELGDYVGKTVTVSGQYSGDTLFIGSIK